MSVLSDTGTIATERIRVGDRVEVCTHLKSKGYCLRARGSLVVEESISLAGLWSLEIRGFRKGGLGVCRFGSPRPASLLWEVCD